MNWHYINPVICALVFATANLALKRALVEGAGAVRSVFVINGTFLVTLLPLWWLFPHGPGPLVWWAPAAAGAAAFVGSFLQSLALKLGDVSVATPLLGAKVLFVALFSTLILGQILPVTWWAGAILAGAGIFLLGQRPGAGQHASRLGLTILLSLGCVAGFALMDIMVAGWARDFGFERFVALQQVVTVSLGLTLIPFFSGSLRAMPRACWPWLLGGALLIVGQFYLLNWTIATHGDPTAVNIFYSSRGLWSVLLVWSIGPLFGNRERGHGLGVFWRRLLGAALLFAAICMVLFGQAFHL